MTPKPQANTLDEKIDYILRNLESESYVNYEKIGIPVDDKSGRNISSAKQAIQTLITEARIDEVEGIINMPPEFDDFYVYLPYRLTKLKENK